MNHEYLVIDFDNHCTAEVPDLYFATKCLIVSNAVPALRRANIFAVAAAHNNNQFPHN